MAGNSSAALAEDSADAMSVAPVILDAWREARGADRADRRDFSSALLGCSPLETLCATVQGCCSSFAIARTRSCRVPTRPIRDSRGTMHAAEPSPCLCIARSSAPTTSTICRIASSASVRIARMQAAFSPILARARLASIQRSIRRASSGCNGARQYRARRRQSGRTKGLPCSNVERVVSPWLCVSSPGSSSARGRCLGPLCGCPGRPYRATLDIRRSDSSGIDRSACSTRAVALGTAGALEPSAGAATVRGGRADRSPD